LLFSTSFGPLVIFDWKRAPRFGVLSLSAKMYMLQHRSQWAHALNRSATRALVTGIALYRNLFRGVWGGVFAVGRGDFASVDRGLPDEHSALNTDDRAQNA